MKTMMLSGVMAAVLSGLAGTALAIEAAPAAADAGTKAAAVESTAKIVVPDISLADLKQAIADKTVTLLDCNGSKAYASGHLPGAIDFESAKMGLEKQLPADKNALIVAYCGGPMCMAYKAGAEAVMKLGYTNVKHFSGGTSGWKDGGEKFESSTLCTKCGQVKGSEACCKAGAMKCEACGMTKDSPGCCAKPKAK